MAMYRWGRILTGVGAVLVLAVGTVIECLLLTGVGVQETYPGAQHDVAVYSILLVWIPVLVVAGSLSGTALHLAGRPKMLGLACAAFGSLALVSFLGVDSDLYGLTALVIMIVALPLNLALAYGLWRLVLQDALRGRP
jgi:hypothetical protein